MEFARQIILPDLHDPIFTETIKQLYSNLIGRLQAAKIRAIP